MNHTERPTECTTLPSPRGARGFPEIRLIQKINRSRFREMLKPAPKLFSCGFPGAEESYQLRVREHHMGVTLQRLEVMPGESFAVFRRDEQPTGSAHQFINIA